MDKDLSQETIEWLRSIDPLDDYGFSIRPALYWLPESPEDEQIRLQWNIDKYEQFIKNGSTFPYEVNERIKQNYIRLSFLKSGLRGVE